MDEITLQTTVSFLEKYNKILILLPKSPVIDNTAAAFAFKAALKNAGKIVEVVSAAQRVPDKLSFLPDSVVAASFQDASSQLVISLDTTKAQLGELSYDTEPGRVLIYLRSKEGFFNPSDVSVNPGQPPFDVILTLGVESPEQLGSVFSEHAELFYALPRINIDVSPHNDNHGTLNLVNVTASSVSEASYHVLSAFKSAQMLPPAATALLAGILAKTDSLRNQFTTPDTFAVVADLIAAGAEYQVVVRHLFKTERLGFLKLWGRSLARLKTAPGRSAAYSVLLEADFDKTGESYGIAPEVLSELQQNVNGMQTIVLGVPRQGGTTIVALQNQQLSLDEFTTALGGKDVELLRLDNGLDIVSFSTEIPIERIEQPLVDALAKALPKPQ